MKRRTPEPRPSFGATAWLVLTIADGCFLIAAIIGSVTHFALFPDTMVETGR